VASIRKSGFTDCFIRENGLDAFDDFREWLLCPEMLFDASEKWWGNRGSRDTSHSGLDLCCYKTSKGKIIHLNDDTKIPAMYAGVLVGMTDDFLGKSLILKHSIPGTEAEDYFTIYGHTHPEQGIHIGRAYKEGETIARVAGMGSSRSKASPHLHLSIGFLSKLIPYDRLDWGNMSDPDTMTLIDPLQVIDKYCIVSTLEL